MIFLITIKTNAVLKKKTALQIDYYFVAVVVVCEIVFRLFTKYEFNYIYSVFFLFCLNASRSSCLH